MTGYRNLTKEQEQSVPSGPPASYPSRSLFNGPGDKAAWDAAHAANPRKPGEEIVVWLERVKAAAEKPTRLPYVDRDPGEEG